MLAGVVLYAVLAQQPCGLTGPIFCPRPPSTFEFAPTSGAGMGVACACTTPTGSKSETLTWAGRSSPATCLKTVGAAPQLIANGDMVTCAANQLRVMPGTDGTSVLGLLAEPAATSLLTFPKDFNTAAWNVAASGVANPTITANQAVGPDGTMTADRVQIPATTVAGGKYSFVYQASTALAVPGSGLIHFRGNGTSGTIGLALFGNGGWHDASCSYVSTGWTPCTNENLGVVGAGIGDLGFGNFSGLAVSGGVDRGAQDVFVWGADLKQEAAVSSYIDSLDGGAQTRAADAIPYVTLRSPISGPASIAASYITPVLGHLDSDGVVGLSPSATPTAPGIGAMFFGGVQAAPKIPTVNSMACFRQGADLVGYTGDTVGFAGTQAVVGRIWCATGGVAPTNFFYGQQSGFYPMAIRGFSLASSNIVTIGGWSTAAPGLGGVIKKVCVGHGAACAGGSLQSTKLAWDGDSIVYGYPEVYSSPPAQLTQLLGSQGKVVVDYGENGDHALDCDAKWTADIKGQGFTTLIWSCAVNDVATDETGAQTAGFVEAALTKALADGERVIVTGVMPWKGSPSGTAPRVAEGNTYNSLISAWASGHGVTFIDTSSMGGQGGDPDVLLTTYDCGDHIHPSQAGQLKLAQLVQAANP